MALPPTIPTSFLPHPSERGVRRSRADFTSALSILAYLLLVLALISAGGVFAYGRILDAQKASKEEKLAQAESAIDSATVESFLRLRDRLVWGQKLLNAHIAPSGFFNLLERVVPTSVRFSQVHLVMDEKGGIKLQATGSARNFNALAAASNALSKDGRVKDAIFSNIAVAPKDGSVGFALSATLDPELVTFVPNAGRAQTATSTTP